MKKYFLTAGLFLGCLAATAQQQPKVDSVFLKNWMHADFDATGVYGVNTMKAKQFLAEHNRKAQPIIVGVLDSGVEYTHEDLKDNMWVNPKEKADNGKDDDKNGFVDDIHGWNFVADKDGKNYAEDTYELTRQYKKLDDYFKQNQSTSNPALYQQYLKLKRDYYTTVGNFKYREATAQATSDYYEPRLEALKKVFGDQTLTQDLVDSFTSEDPLALEGLAIFSSLPAKDWEGKKIGEVTDLYRQRRLAPALRYADNMLKYAYNTDYNPKAGIGKKYGNNDVQGLSFSHGTHVAGIIAAEWDNDLGMYGTGGGNNVKIMSVRVVPDGDERDEDIANGIRYAVDNGAKILNMSFGKSYDDNHQLVVDAFKYAEKHNVLIVKSAGNDNKDIDVDIKYPITLINGVQFSPTTITVGASTINPEKLRAGFSNWGKISVDVFGPGTQIYSTYEGNKYRYLQGTSMASPAVAGVAALVWSHYPKLSAKDIKNILVETVNKNDQLTDISVSGGVVDSYKAVQKAEELYKARKLK